MTEEIEQRFQEFLKELPDNIDWSAFKQFATSAITAEKNTRTHFCILCTNDVDKLESIKKFDAIKLRQGIKIEFLEHSPVAFEGYVCPAHWTEYGLNNLIRTYLDLKSQNLDGASWNKLRKEAKKVYQEQVNGR